MFFAFFFEGSTSKDADIGSGYLLMLCRKFVVFFLLFFTFCVIKIEPGPKSEF